MWETQGRSVCVFIRCSQIDFYKGSGTRVPWASPLTCSPTINTSVLKCKPRVETEAPGAGWLHGGWCSTAEDIKMLVCTRWRYMLLVVASAYCMHRYIVLFVFEWAPLCFWGNESLKSSDTNAEHEKRGGEKLLMDGEKNDIWRRTFHKRETIWATLLFS